MNDLYMFGGLIVVAAIAHLIGLRAERHGRRYWIWFLLALPFGPIGAALAFLVLEAGIREQRGHQVQQKCDRSLEQRQTPADSADNLKSRE